MDLYSLEILDDPFSSYTVNYLRICEGDAKRSGSILLMCELNLSLIIMLLFIKVRRNNKGNIILTSKIDSDSLY